jgi:2-(1,2-epoxy-1,2-dihydrophenyl)acetyl-CoA isomerase
MAFSGCEMNSPSDQALPIRLERSASGIATLTLCAAKRKNVITHEFAAALLAHCQSLRGDPNTRAVLLRAEGPVFSAGADIMDMAAHQENLPAYLRGLIDIAHEAMLALHDLPMPVIACLQGVAAGGGVSLALACDLVVAARSARLVIAYPQLGTTPDCGLSHALMQRLGTQRALELFLITDEIDARQALALGLVAQVADDDAAVEAAHASANRLAQMPPPAMVGAKRLFLAGSRSALKTQLERERRSFLRCADTPQFRERVLSFVERRRLRDREGASTG